MIRPARYSDFEAIKKIFQVAFDAEYKQRGIDIVHRIAQYQKIYPVLKFLALFPNPYQHLFNVYVYEEKKQVAGMIQITSRNKAQTHWNIDNIAVLPEFRGKGIAKNIINHIFETYGQKGALSFTLEVDIKNKNAIKVYEALGMRHYATVFYYRIPAPKEKRKKTFDSVSIPYKMRPYKKSDAQAMLNLYMASIPLEMRPVEQRDPSDFQEGTFETFYKYMKKQLKYSCYENWVIEDPNNPGELIGSLVITAQHRKLPHVMKITLNPGYEEQLTEELIKYAFNYLEQYPPRQILIAALENQKAKRKMIEKYDFKSFTADYMMVRDNLLVIKLPQKENVVKNIEGESTLKPSFKQPN